MLFGLFSKKNKELNPPAFGYDRLGVDMHSHVLPGIDDGAQTIEDSIAMLRAFQDMGFKKVITTPHIMVDYYKNTPEIILSGLEKVREAIIQHNLTIEMDAAAEYYADEYFDVCLEKNRILSMGGKYVLFELSYVNPPADVFGIIARIKGAGYVPVLAHPERYPFYFNSFEKYKQFRDEGCLLQVSTISLVGYYGPKSKNIAERMVDEMMVDFLASDMHGLRHANAMRDALHQPYVQKVLGEHALHNSLLL